MKCLGVLKNLSLNFETQNPEVTLEVSAKAEDIEALKGKKLSVEIKQYRQKRSLDANAYYWTLCSQIAEAIGQSTSYTHNMLLRKFGQIEMVDGRIVYLVIPDSDAATKAVEEAETYHLKPTSQVNEGKDGVLYRTYEMLRGSHTYNTKEMSRLIDGTAEEAKALGIETISDRRLRGLMISYGKHYAKRQRQE